VRPWIGNRRFEGKINMDSGHGCIVVVIHMHCPTFLKPGSSLNVFTANRGAAGRNVYKKVDVKKLLKDETVRGTLHGHGNALGMSKGNDLGKTRRARAHTGAEELYVDMLAYIHT
jgi:hypothetical protein